jgi:sialidase-1
VDVFRTPDPGTPVAQARCYRIPSIAEVDGTILAFAEERGAGCGDNGLGHNVVLKRSSDGGRSWGPLIRVVGSEANLQPGGVGYSNAMPVVLRPSGRLILHYGTQDNPCAGCGHGTTHQIITDDAGLTWHSDTIIGGFLPKEYPGALPGPGRGLQQQCWRMGDC